jgi:retron-type reverse transcriptase
MELCAPWSSGSQAARAHVESGRRWVVDIDLEKFFDRVNHDVLMARVARRIKDKRMLRLIRRYLQSGIMEGGLAQPREEGTPQGGPLTPQTHLVNSNFQSACPWCDGIGIWVLDTTP